MSEAEDFLQEISLDGQLDSEGVFTFDSKAAFRKLKEFRVSDTNEYGLFFVRSLVTGGAQDIQLRIDSDDFEIRFRGGKLWAQELDLLASGRLDGSWSSKYLMWGLETCRATGMSWVRFHTDQQCWEFSGEKVRKFASFETGLIHVKRSIGLEVLNRFWRKDTPELDLILDRYRHFGEQLQINGVLAKSDPLPFQRSLLAKVIHGSAAPLRIEPETRLLEPRLPPPADVVLVISCPLLVIQSGLGQDRSVVDNKQIGGLNIFLGGAFQERIINSGLSWPFEMAMSIDGIELDLSLNHILRGRALQLWVDWIKPLEVPLFEMLCREQLRFPNAALASSLAEKALELRRLDRSGPEESLLTLLNRTPMFLSASEEFLTLEHIESSKEPYSLAPEQMYYFDKLELSQAGSRKQRARVLILGKPERELIKLSKASVLEDVRQFVKSPGLAVISRSSRLSLDDLLKHFYRVAKFSFADMKRSGQVYTLGRLILDAQARTLSTAGVTRAIQELKKFEIYTYTQQGDNTSHHYVLIRLQTAEGELFYGDRGKDHNEYDEEYAKEFHLFKDNSEQFLKAAKSAGAQLVSLD